MFKSILKLASQFTQMLHLKVQVPPLVTYLQAWLKVEKLMHIDVLYPKAILLALKSFLKTSHKHIKIMSDNTTIIHWINKMGTSHSMECHQQVLKIWQ